MATSAAELLGAIQEWMFSDDGIAAQMEKFATDYCAYFDFIADRNDFESAENKLMYTEVYKKFQELFEGEISAFLARHGWSADLFLATCQEELHKKEDGHESWASVYEIIVSLSDYQIFKVMMLDTRRRYGDSTATA